MSNSSLDLLGLFVENFDIDIIYNLGWYTAQNWMALVSGVVMAIAIGIRTLEEKVSMIAKGKSAYLQMVSHVLIITVAIGLYFALANLIVLFFNSIYGALDSSHALMSIAGKLDTFMSSLFKKEFDFDWSQIVDGIYSAFAMIAYGVTYCILVFVIIAMRTAHAVLVSFCLFWGAVALPMSITVGLKQLTAWKNICIMALLWPIIDAFFMYLIGNTFSIMLEKSSLGMDDVTTWSMSTLLFYLATFSIINLFLIATTLSAPFVAQGLANGTGNVSGMIASFGGAGVAAGLIASKFVMDKSNSGGSITSQKGAQALRNTGGLIKNKMGFNSSESSHTAPSNSNDLKSNTMQRDSGCQNTSSEPKGNNLSSSSEQSTQQQISTNADSHPSNPPSEDAMESTEVKKKKAQAKRGAIINQHKNLKGKI